MACAPRDQEYNRRLKTFHDVYLGMYMVCSVHFWFTSGQAATSRALFRLRIQLFFLNKKFQGGG